ncbi:acyl-CoA dehydrogenase family protein [Streptomyces boninensis]|uniref:acyl-CoA dehydrogenase family protein n=1 Tax=Streptomyces boninensis TaxID=2039455 RepID=UPI003B20C2B2
MDFTFTEEQQAAAEAAKAVFSGVKPDAVPSPSHTAGPVADDFDRPLWRKLAESDLTGLVLDERYGGSGLDITALCLALREAAGPLARVPLLETAAAALALQRYGDDELCAELLPQVVRGEYVLTAATAGRTGHGPAELAVTAREDGDGWVLDGVHTAVPWAQQADAIVLPAHVGESGRPVLALVRGSSTGVTLTDQVTTTGERLAEVRLDAARPDAVLTADGAWEWLRAVLTVGTCAQALGLGQRVLDMTSEYAAKREQFGYPIATFQAVAVQAADRFIDLKAMEATLWQAVWRLKPADVAVAKIWAAEGVRRTVQTAQHLHGGFGADTDYPLHRYHAWAKQLELSLGPASAHEEELGELLAAE